MHRPCSNENNTPRPIHWRIQSTLVISVLLWAASLCSAAEPATRSTRQARRHAVDELDLPRYERRVSHRGWEIRSRHFVVVSTESSAEAERVAGELEATWVRIGRLADYWTKLHRQPTFATSAVGVLITRESRGTRRAPASDLRLADGELDIYLQMPKGSEHFEKCLPDVRRGAWSTFLRVTELEHRLPDWVRTGLGEYFAREQSGSGSPPKDNSARAEAALWIRYLLEGDDARHAPAFLLAVGDVLNREPDERIYNTHAVRGRGRPTFDGEPPQQWHPESLTRQGNILAQFGRWREEPLVGQPVLEALPENDPQLADEARRVVVLLKLLNRQGAPGQPTVRPRAYALVDGQQRDLTAAVTDPDSDHEVDLEALRRRLSGPEAIPWATIDADGELLLWNDRERIDSFFGGPTSPFSASKRDGRVVVASRMADGRTLEGWLEENSDTERTGRPVARFKLIAREAARPKVNERN